MKQTNNCISDNSTNNTTASIVWVREVLVRQSPWVREGAAGSPFMNCQPKRGYNFT